MSQTLTDLFEARGTNSVVWQGRQVMALVEIPVGPGDRIRVRRLGSSLVRAQAIKLAVDRGALTVGGYSGPVVALWSHTAPADLLLQVDGPATAVQLWNAWSLDGVDNSWLGNAAIMVDDHGGGLTLQCSDGVGEPDFSDLVVWVAVTSSRPPAPVEPEAKPEAAPKRQGAPQTRPITKTSAAPTAKPAAPTAKPAAPTSQPAAQPAAPTSQPAAQPAMPTSQPATPISKPMPIGSTDTTSPPAKPEPNVSAPSTTASPPRSAPSQAPTAPETTPSTPAPPRSESRPETTPPGLEERAPTAASSPGASNDSTGDRSDSTAATSDANNSESADPDTDNSQDK